MGVIGGIIILLAVIAGIASLVFWIIMLVKFFTNDMVLHGVIGIICSLWAFIYGWMKADELGARNIMMYWTIAIVAGIVLNVIGNVLIGMSQ